MLWSFNRLPRSSPPPLLGQMPSFEMLNQEGKTINDTDLKGSILIIDFFFTRCPSICPRLTTHMVEIDQSLLKRWKELANPLPVRLLSITVDPENDTPPQLLRYAQKYGADASRWFFLTGESQDLDRVVIQGFKLFYQKANPSAGIMEIMHGNWLVLVDQKGNIRGYYDAEDAQRAKQLLRDVEWLALQKPHEL
ncbi:hypothetical protein BCY86_08555 [Pajaroellobacter abortibovis]|uniref:Thioredoxin domain-containing protein n=2 Tax=Pajaroellobacter abortibovis TaxID=1882918 RepID=A0A1L6MZJ9_9BACT|nr:hypothetical protein BCY86_08555 [Pajaroellobacter abortibovis]